MPDSIQNSMFAPCGMDCMVCYVHLKKKKPCGGCLSDPCNKPERCRQCNIKQCAQDRELVHCYNCNDFPCKSIKSLDKSYRSRYQASLIENGNTAQKKGVEALLRLDRSRYICTCGGVISLHDKECSECGEKRPG